MLTLNTQEYRYKDICDELGWQVSTGEQRKRQIKCIEESYEFYHPICVKTGKLKKAYVFTKMIKEPVLIDYRINNGGKYLLSEEDFDYLWRHIVYEGYKLNKYYEREWRNDIYITTSLIYLGFGMNPFYELNKITFKDEIIKKIFSDIVIGAVKSNTIGRLCKRYGYKKNSLPKGIIRALNGNKLKTYIADDKLLEIYNEYEKIALEKKGYKKLREAIADGKYQEVTGEVVDKIAEKYKKYNVKRLNKISVDDIDLESLEHTCFYTQPSENNFRTVIYDSIRNSCLSRVYDKKNYKFKMNDKQKELLKNYYKQFTGEDLIEDIEVDMSWLDNIA